MKSGYIFLLVLYIKTDSIFLSQ